MSDNDYTQKQETIKPSESKKEASVTAEPTANNKDQENKIDANQKNAKASSKVDSKQSLEKANTTSTPQITENNATVTKPKIAKPSSTSSSKTKVSNTKASNTTASNKLTILALVIASVSIATSIGHFVWQQQTSSKQLLALSQQNNQAIEQSRAQLKSKLTSEFNKQLKQQQQKADKLLKQSVTDNDTKLQLISTQLSQLEQQVEQSDPSDWLIHEAEYLVRIAARTMWLERDTKAAIGLLREADERLKSLNQPKFLPVRALINEDIEALGLMPTLENQAAILTLMALNKQISSLTLTSVDLSTENDEAEADLTLSEDLNDWQENLSKTWDEILSNFITVRRRTGLVEPLMAPEQQEHLKQNLSLKIQLAQWAASEQKGDIYQQTLVDIQQWLNEFFDMDLAMNKNFYSSIEQLRKKTIYYNYPSDLSSLSAMKRLLNNTQKPTQRNKVQAKASGSNTDKAEGTQL